MASYEEEDLNPSSQQYSQYSNADQSIVPLQPNGVIEQQAQSEENTSTVESQPQQSELERYWEAVKTNPDDFNSWEYLIRIAESADGGLTPQSTQETIANMRNVFDQFLAKFPLCFGYWKKYADFEFMIQGPLEAEKIYERGVEAIPNSVDLWTQYCSFKIEHYPDDIEGIRGLFERGATRAGYDFLSHLFWEKYLEFEKSKEAYDCVLKILDRIIRIPMHQYAKFFDEPISELLPPDQLKQFIAEAQATPQPSTTEGTEDEQPPTEKTEEQIQSEIRTRIYNINVENYMKTQVETNKRWVFEQEIKRPYFHVKAMDEIQLSNWRRYLEFEEGEGDETRIQVLYERCLVACALYEEFWQKYARWMVSKNRIEDARNIYIRATTVFVPISRPSIRLSYACFEEQEGNIEKARSIYKGIIESYDLTEPINILTNSLENTAQLDDKSKAFLSVQHAKLIWHCKGSVEEARQNFQEASSKYLDSKYFWLNYFNFEISQNDSEVETRLKSLFDQIRNTSTLPPETIRDLSNRYLDFLMERGKSIFDYNKVDIESNTQPLSNRTSTSTTTTIDYSKKRSGSEEDILDNNKPTKQMRLDHASTMGGVVDNSNVAAAAGVNTNNSSLIATPTNAVPPYAAAAQPTTAAAQNNYYAAQGQWNATGYPGYPTAATTAQT
ncbi:1715_t:CDS:10, partial [Entrophospora sp. SA101]